MRNNYSCYYGIKIEDKIYDNISSSSKVKFEHFHLGTACWSGLQRLPLKTKYIYIYKFNNTKDLPRLVQLINNITSCKIVKINNKKYIRYKLIDWDKDRVKNRACFFYSKNLLLLNIIRLNWYRASQFNIDQFKKDIFNNCRGTDSLYFLLKCIKDNVIDKSQGRGINFGDHSPIYKNIILKKKKDLFKYKGNSMQIFLTK